MSELKKEIVFLLNEFSFEVDKNIQILASVLNIHISNIADIYKEKIKELENMFKKRNISLYENDLLMDLVCNYFDNYYIKANKILTNLACKVLNKNISLKYFYKKIKLYEEICRNLSNFMVEYDIEKIFKNLENIEYRKQYCLFQSSLYQIQPHNDKVRHYVK